MSWDSDLWDVHKQIFQYLDNNVQFLRNFKRYTEKRMQIEREYAQQLKRAANEFLPKSKDECSSYTYLHAFQEFLKENISIANQHEVIADNLEANVQKKLKVYVKQLSDDIRIVQRDITVYENKLSQAEKKLQSVKASYQGAHVAVISANEALMRAESDRSLSRNELDKIKAICENKKTAFEMALQEYASENQIANTARRNYYSNELPGALARYSALERSRIDNTALYITESCKAEQSVMHIINICHNDIGKAVNTINGDADIRTVAQKLRNDIAIPGEFEFIQLDPNSGGVGLSSASSANGSGSNISKNSGTISKGSKSRGGFLGGLFNSGNSATDKNDGGKQKVKIRQCIKEKEILLEKQTKTILGIKSVINNYTNNPQFGNPAPVIAQLREEEVKLQQIQEDIRRLKSELGLDDKDVVLSNQSQARRQSSTKASSSVPAAATTPISKPSSHSDDSDGDFEDEFNNDDHWSESSPSQQDTTSLTARSVYSTSAKPDLNNADGHVFCCAKFAFPKGDPDSLSMSVDEWFYVVEYDTGDGWTKVARYSDPQQVGYVPSSYLEIHDATAA